MSLATSHLRVELTDRDLALFRGLFEARVMTLHHAATFHFNGSVEAVTKRVQKLKAAGYLAERLRLMNAPSILCLTRKAFAELRSRGALDGYPDLDWSTQAKRIRVSDFTLRHELDVLDVRAAFWRAVAAADSFELIEFCTWPRMSQFTAKASAAGGEVLCKPDAFVRVAQTSADGRRLIHSFFFEVDRSTESQSTLAAKLACYGDFYRRGGFAERQGRSWSDWKSFPFRVLITCRTAERCNNAAERLLKNRPQVLSQAWLTTFDEVINDPLRAIWMTPADYAAAVADTEFASRADRLVYRRQSSREETIDRRVKKRSLVRRLPRSSSEAAESSTG